MIFHHISKYYINECYLGKKERKEFCYVDGNYSMLNLHKYQILSKFGSMQMTTNNTYDEGQSRGFIDTKFCFKNPYDQAEDIFFFFFFNKLL